ncbi:MAG: DUF1599 domain-containing protein [Bacteroidales bacterium]
MKKTLSQYNQIVTICRDIFEKKMKDYGTSWRILRAESVTDQIYIKAQRIQSIEQKKLQKIGDDIRSEFIGIVNYSIIGLIQLGAVDETPVNMEPAEVMALYDQKVENVRNLMIAKNHDYGEAWRSMRISSFTDLILMKIYRTKQIEDHLGQTLVSEGIDANYMDMMNYAIFALIKIDFKD